jgi:alkylmercury lyase
LSTWCAEDTLFLPALLGQTATVESPSPVSRESVRLTIAPEGVQAVSPTGAVVSIALVDPDQVAFGSVEAIWMTFCRHIHDRAEPPHRPIPQGVREHGGERR